MSRRLIRPEAEADILETAVWYDAREFGLGLAFTSEVHAAILRAPKVHFIIRSYVRAHTFDAFSLVDFPIAFSMSDELMRLGSLLCFTPRNMSDIGKND